LFRNRAIDFKWCALSGFPEGIKLDGVAPPVTRSHEELSNRI
jgi:hypothetical protein